MPFQWLKTAGEALADFDSVTDVDGDLAAAAAAVKIGTNGFEVTFDNGTAAYGVLDGSAIDRTQGTLDFFYNPNSFSPGETGDIIFGGLYPSAGTPMFDIIIGKSATEYTIRARYLNDAGTQPAVGGTHTISSDMAWVHCRLVFKRSTGAGNDDGWATFYVVDNGTLYTYSSTGIDNDTRDWDFMRMGMIGNFMTGFGGSFYFDEVKLAEEPLLITSFEPTWMDGAELRAGRSDDEPLAPSTAKFTQYFNGSLPPSRYTADSYESRASYRFNPNNQTSFMRIPSGGAQAGSGVIETQWNTSLDSHWFGFHMKWRSLPAAQIQWMRGAASGFTDTSLRMNTDGSISIVHNGGTDNSGAQVITVNTWYQVSFTLGRNSPIQIIVREVGGSQAEVINLLASDNHPNNLNLVVFGNESNATYDVLIDNFVVDNQTESGQPGDPFHLMGADYFIRSLIPNGNGIHQDQSPGAGDGDYRDVDEVPHDSLTTCWTLNNGGDRFTATLEPPGGGVSDIFATMQSVFLISGSFACAIQGSIRVGGADYDGPTTGIPTGGNGWVSNDHLRLVNPDTGIAWTRSDLVGVELGLEAITATSDPKVTMMGLEYLAIQRASRTQVYIVG
jgi:hypothetical protein